VWLFAKQEESTVISIKESNLLQRKRVMHNYFLFLKKQKTNDNGKKFICST